MAGDVVHHQVVVSGVELHVAECGEGPLVLLCHGWPELWWSWRHQLPVLAEAGYRAVAPDQRGYGRSGRPEPVEDYDIVHLAGDVVGLIDALGEERGVLVGHEEFAVYEAEFRRTGFTGGINWYRNLDRNWELTAGVAERKIEVPAMFLAGERDPVLSFLPVEPMRAQVSDLREFVLVPGAGHWIQQERPAETNEALLRFLAGLSL